MKIKDCWAFYKETHLPTTASAGKTLARWEQVKMLGEIPAEDITHAEIGVYIKIRKVSPSTINRDLTLLNAIIRHAWKHGKITKMSFIQKLPAAPPKLRYLTREEVDTLLNSLGGMDWQTKVFVMIALASGARAGAILDLTWDKVDLTAGTVDFRAIDPLAARRKGRAVVPINDMMREALEIAKEHYSFSSGPRYVVWSGAEGGRLSSVQRMFQRLEKRSGIQGLTAHVLRHTVASLLLQEGEDLLKVSRLIGHKNSKITEEVYFSHASQWLRGTTDKLSFGSERRKK